MSDNLTERSESQYPGGYDSSGRSLFYTDQGVERAQGYLGLYRRAPLRFGSPEDLTLIDISTTKHPDVPSPWWGLKEYIRTSYGKDKTPVYVFDDHNHAFFAWFEALSEGRIEKGATLFHFDDHLDGKKPSRLPSGESLEEFARYTKALEFDNFIDPALRLDLVDNVYWINWPYDHPSRIEEETKYEIKCVDTGSEELSALLDQRPVDLKKTILDIDLDYFAPDPKKEEIEVQRIGKMLPRAGVITFSISPGFIDEKRAVSLVKRILKI